MEGQTDFSRLAEGTYREVGTSQKETTLDAFTKHAVSVAISNHQKKCTIIYPGVAGQKLGITVKKGEKCDITKIDLRGESDDLFGLITLLSGNLRAEYDESPVTIPTTGVKGNNVQVGYLNLHVIPRGTEYIAKTAEIRGRKTAEERKTLNLEKVVLDTETREILSKAGRIVVKGTTHDEDDQRNDITHEECTIVQPEQGSFVWHLAMSGVNNFPLALSVYRKIEKAFEMTRKGFDQTAYDKYLVRYPGQSDGVFHE